MNQEELLEKIVPEIWQVLTKYSNEENAVSMISLSLAVIFLNLRMSVNKGNQEKAIEEISQYINIAIQFKPKE